MNSGKSEGRALTSYDQVPEQVTGGNLGRAAGLKVREGKGAYNKGNSGNLKPRDLSSFVLYKKGHLTKRKVE